MIVALAVALSTVVLLAVSLSWATIVELTPADQRPYVGSTNNSVLNLMAGYNGLERLTGMGGSPAALGASRQTTAHNLNALLAASRLKGRIMVFPVMADKVHQQADRHRVDGHRTGHHKAPADLAVEAVDLSTRVSLAHCGC